MGTRARPNKREVILDAMLDIIVERGLHDAPMSLLSERANASPGIIYHHFSSKQEIIDALYVRVQTMKAANFLQGYRPGMESRQAFLQIWLNGYEFYRSRAQEMRFLEQYQSSGFTPPAGERVVSGDEQDFQTRFRCKAEGGVLRDWPLEVLHDLTVEVVARLAKLPHTLEESVLLEIGEQMWEMVKA